MPSHIDDVIAMARARKAVVKSAIDDDGIRIVQDGRAVCLDWSAYWNLLAQVNRHVQGI